MHALNSFLYSLEHLFKYDFSSTKIQCDLFLNGAIYLLQYYSFYAIYKTLHLHVIQYIMCY